jgi:GAF domain-containing protein
MGTDIDRTDEVQRVEAVLQTGLTNTPDAAMDRLASLVARLLGSPVGLVSLVDDHRQFFPGQLGLPDPLSDVRETPLEQSLCRTVVTSGQLLQIDDTADHQWALHGARTVLGVGSYLGAPLVDGENRVLGSMCAIGVEPRQWTADERQTLSDLAIAASSELQARIAVNEARRARDASDAARARIEMMADVSAALISTMDPADAMERLLDVLVDRFAMWAFVFMSGTADAPPQVFARHRVSDMHRALEALTSESSVRLRDMAMTRSVLDGARPFVLLDLQQARAAVDRAGVSSPIFHDLGVGSVLIVPMAVGDVVIGALTLFGDPDGADFTTVDVTLAADLAQRAAMTFEHARLYAREHRVAFELQHSLLPDLPRVVGIGVDAVYRAAAYGVDVGGDWYDLIDIGDGSFFACVGDVTGHNIQAAVAMARVQSAIRIFVAGGLGPADIVDRVASVARTVLGDLMATCLVAHLAPADDGTWTATVANAGHLPPIVVHADGKADVMEIRNDPLFGAANPSKRRASNAQLAAGSTLILYTDGLIEHRREPIDDGIERLRVAASQAGAGPVEGLCARLVHALSPDGRDDIACISIRL